MKKLRSRLPLIIVAWIIIFHTTGIKPVVYGEFGPSLWEYEQYEDYTSESFEAALASSENVVVYVWANRCPTCTRFEESLLSTIDQIPDDLTILAADIDRDTHLLASYGVRSQSTTLYFDKQGSLLKKQVARDHNLNNILQTLTTIK